jgi:surfeit locus 1 family protein
MPDTGAGGRRHPFLLPMAVSGALAVLAGLGTWQLDRLQWKRGLIAERRAAMSAPSADLRDAADARGLPEFRHVRVRGTFRHESELLVGPRTRTGAGGWHAVTPLRLETGGWVLVDRGFVPEDRKRPATRPDGQVRGAVAIDGLLRRPAPAGAFVPANDPVRGAWFRIDPPAMGQALGLGGTAPFWVAAGPAPNPGGLPIGGGDAAMPRNEHLQYAITWYALAAVLLAIAMILRRQQRRGRAGPARRR